MLGQSMDPAVISAIINGVRLTHRRSPSLMSDKLAGHVALLQTAGEPPMRNSSSFPPTISLLDA